MKLTMIQNAAKEMDWPQVILNGGPPGFYLCDDGHFCGRAERWEVHGEANFHNFVSLADLIDNQQLAHQQPSATDEPLFGEHIKEATDAIKPL